MNTFNAEIKKGRKYNDVLAGARTVFLRDGFEGAKVDSIAREAKVSKATLYSYFADKKDLFLEVASREAVAQADAYRSEMDESLPPHVILPAAGRKLLDFMLSEIGQSMFRIAVAESGRFPEIGKRFYQNGPMLVRERLKQYFEQCIARGELVIDDLDLAAEQFAELCKVRAQLCCILGQRDMDSEAERDLIVTNAVGMFLSYYGPN